MQNIKNLGQISRNRPLNGILTHDGAFAVDKEQRIIYWAESAERLLGHRAEEVLSRPCYEVMAAGDYLGHPFCRRNCPTIVNSRRGRVTCNYDLATTTKEGKRIWVNVGVVLLRLEEGEPTVLHLFRDVTKRRRLEEKAQAVIAALRELDSSLTRDQEVEFSPYPVPMPHLSRRELDVLRLLACGMPTSQMAEALSITRATVRNHVTRILTKLGTSSRLQAIIYASQHHLV